MALYHHVPSKQALLDAVVAKAFQRLDRLPKRWAHVPDRPERLYLLSEAYLRCVAPLPQLSRHLARGPASLAHARFAALFEAAVGVPVNEGTSWPKRATCWSTTCTALRWRVPRSAPDHCRPAGRCSCRFCERACSGRTRDSGRRAVIRPDLRPYRTANDDPTHAAFRHRSRVRSLAGERLDGRFRLAERHAPAPKCAFGLSRWAHGGLGPERRLWLQHTVQWAAS